MASVRRNLWSAGPLLALLVLAGCQSLGYYAQAAGGQLELLRERRPVKRVLADLARNPGEHAAQLSRQLTDSQAVLDFAERELGLAAGKRYRSYADLHRPYVVWNVFAAPELALEAHEWCYPVVGCAPYRGYFKASAAQRMAASLQARGMDTYVGGVAAYSTLGRFDDPLLNTFIGWPRQELAELLIHELAHGVVWLPGDVRFNESYATFAGTRGAQQWLAGEADVPADATGGRAWPRLTRLLVATRSRLDAVYAAPSSDVERRDRKAAVLAAARACYAEQRERLGNGRYDALMAGLNNASLLAIATYEDLVPAFARLFSALGGDWRAFHASVAALADLPEEERTARLAALMRSAEDDVADQADDDHAEDIQCEALDRHIARAEAARTENDDVRRGGDG
jgi:predicted aminopeptidase